MRGIVTLGGKWTPERHLLVILGELTLPASIAGLLWQRPDILEILNVTLK